MMSMAFSSFPLYCYFFSFFFAFFFFFSRYPGRREARGRGWTYREGHMDFALRRKELARYANRMAFSFSGWHSLSFSPLLAWRWVFLGFVVFITADTKKKTACTLWLSLLACAFFF